MKLRCVKRARQSCALSFVFALLLTGCGGGGGAPSFMPATATAAAPPADPPASTGSSEPAPVTVMPVPEDPSVLTRFSHTVPFGEKGGFVASDQIVYELGTTAVADAKYKDVIYTVPLRGTVRYPSAAVESGSSSKPQLSPSGGFPVVVFLHGMHDSSELNNAKGYDYLQRDLAENGYVAVSIDAGKINGLNNDNASDAGALARGQLLMTTLDILRAGNATGVFNGVERAELKGKLDLDRVGILGHSRGAEAVAYAVELNKQRIGISFQDVQTARALRLGVSLAEADQAKAKAAVDSATIPAAAAAAKLKAAKDALKNARALVPAAPASVISALTQAVQDLQGPAKSTQAVLTAQKAALDAVEARLRDALAKVVPLQPINNDSTSWLATVNSQNALQQSGIVLPSSTEAPHKIRAVFSLAPINARRLSGVTHVPFATLLPMCDGDVYNMPGAQIFDDSRYTASDDSAPKFQLAARGANHNFYNSYWAEDDDAGSSSASLYCNKPGLIETLRISAPDQRRNGAFLIESFMRYFVGDEVQYAPYWKGQAPIPAAGCPAGESSCDERVVMTIHQPAGSRMLLQDFRNADSATKNPLGLSATFDGFQQAIQCQFLTLGLDLPAFGVPSSRPASCTDTSTGLSAQSLYAPGDNYAYRNYFPPGQQLIWSITDQAQLQWSKAGASMQVNTGDLSASGFDTLSFRMAVVTSIGQEVEVSVTDTQGRSGTVRGSDFTDALYNIARKPNGSIPLVDAPEDAIYADTGVTRPLLNMVAIPLKAFTLRNVDIGHIRQVTFRFPKASGSVAVNDVQLQRMN
jgi:dienelactone hydrolase